MGRVWAVFSDNSAREIVMTRVGPDENGRLCLEHSGIHNLDVVTSAEKAIRSACNVLISQKVLADRKLGFCYEFEENSQVIKTSASLAFALKFVDKIEAFPFSVAATGVVSESSGTGEIGQVGSLNEKLDAALRKLEKGDLFFYPLKNEGSIRPRLLAEAEEAGVDLVAVRTVQEAIFEIRKRCRAKKFPAPGATKTTNARHGVLVAALVVLAVVGVLFKAGIVPFDFSPEKRVHPPAQAPQKPEGPAQVHSVGLSKNSTTPMEKKAKDFLENEHSSIDKKSQDAATDAKMGPRKVATKKVGLNFQGEDPEAVGAVKELFETWLRQKGYEIDAKDHDIEISGAVRLEQERTQPRMPYANQSLTLVERDFFLDQVRFSPENGAPVTIGDFASILEYAAGGRENWRDALADSIVSGKNTVFAEVSEVLDRSNDIVERRQY